MTLGSEDARGLILQTNSGATVLVGGQAVGFWARRYGIASSLAVLTTDIDYLALGAEAKAVSASLYAQHVDHELKLAALGDQTPNSAVIVITDKKYEEPIIVDYLTQVVGLETSKAREAAVLVKLEGREIRVLHPLDLLRSKMSHLYELAHKRTPEGIEQARLAILIVAAYIEEQATQESEPRNTLDRIEAVAALATTLAAIAAKVRWKLNCLDAVPASIFTSRQLPEEFYSRRWPQVLKQVDRLTSKLASRWRSETDGNAGAKGTG